VAEEKDLLPSISMSESRRSRKAGFETKSAISASGRAMALDPRGATTSTEALREAASWPVRDAFAPDPGLWRATGCGTAAVIRAGPDGRVGVAIVVLQLIKGGVVTATGGVMTSRLGEEYLALASELPPWTRAAVDEAAAYTYGALAFGEEMGVEPGESMSTLLALFGPPRPAAAALSDLEQRTGERLLALVRRNFDLEAIETLEKEPAIQLEMTLRGASRSEALRELRAQEDFAEAGIEGIFGWLPELPKDRPRRGGGGLRLVGDVRVASDGTLRADATSLGTGAIFASRLKRLLGDRLVVAEADWRDAKDLLDEGDDPKPYDDDVCDDDESNPPEDFAVDEPAVKTPGRNHPCWCGSGKKYKKCHLRQDESR